MNQTLETTEAGKLLACSRFRMLLAFLLLFPSLGAQFIGIDESCRESNPHITHPLYEAVSVEISEKEMVQTRHNFGVNFGGVFVREKWIFHSTFPANTNTELEAVSKAASANRLNAQRDLEAHWKLYAQDSDWDWLKQNGVNSVRIPIGYWNINGGKFTEGTRFEPYRDIYCNSWEILKSHYIEPAAKRGISILIDLHAVPGGANSGEHSGEGSGKAEFFANLHYQEILIQGIEFIVKDLKRYNNIYGIGIVNEADFAFSPVAQRKFYESAMKAVRRHDSTIPLVISDGWWPYQMAEWIQDGQSKGDSSFYGFVVDHHVYRTFSDSDRSKTAEQIIQDLDQDLLTNLRDDGKGVDFLVGELSVVLSRETWVKSGVDPNNDNDPKRLSYVAGFGNAEYHLIKQRARAGLFFWTYKFESGNGGEWDFRHQVGRLIYPPQIYLPDDITLTKLKEVKLSQWTPCDTTKMTRFSRIYFTEGFDQAWKDGTAYARRGALIGRKNALQQARLQQFARIDGSLIHAKDWKTGYETGLREIEAVVCGK